MRRALVLLTCISFSLLQSCATHSISKNHAEKRARESETRAVALQWLQLLDAGDYAQAREQESARLRTSTTVGQFIRSMEGRRAPFGRVLSRTFVGAAYTPKLTGSPDGRYESILFKTAFEHKALAAERVILTQESGQWRVVDYRVY